MSLALLVYAVAQRRIPQSLALENDVLLYPIYGATKRPTFRRVMQMFLGLNEVMVTINGTLTKMVAGMNEFRERIVRLISVGAAEIHLLKKPSG